MQIIFVVLSKWKYNNILSVLSALVLFHLVVVFSNASSIVHNHEHISIPLLPVNGPSFINMPSDPNSCFTGTYRILGDDAVQNSGRCNGFKKCEPGFYCSKDNIKRKCPKGRYGKTIGLTNEQCTGLCPKGHYCPEQTVNPIPCGGTHLYCPEGSFIPKYNPIFKR